MKKVTSAGGIVFKNDQDKKILLTIFTHIHGLGFAKGHVEAGETLKQAALREVTEETGLTDLKIIKKLGVYSKQSTERDGTQVFKDIHMYLMVSEKPDFHRTAEELYGWFDAHDAVKQMAVKEDREFLEKILESI